MSDYHTIRLHGPWQAVFFSHRCRALLGVHSSPSQRRIRLPLDAGVQEIIGEDSSQELESQIVLSRKFNWPHATQDPMFLNVDSNIDWEITLNGQAISKVNADQSASISCLLVSQNQLQLAAKLSLLADVQIREVSLKIAQSKV